MNSIHLALQPIKQRNNKECWSTCLAMVLEYYGTAVNLEELDAFAIKNSSGFSFMTEAARFAKSRGFRVDCLAYNLCFTSPQDLQLTPSELVEKLRAEQQTMEHGVGLESMIKTIEEGVHYLIKKPDLQDIYQYLRLGIPVIVTVNKAAYYDQQGGTGIGHDLVIIGCKANQFEIIDPGEGVIEFVQVSHVQFSMSQFVIEAAAYLLAIYSKKSEIVSSA